MGGFLLATAQCPHHVPSSRGPWLPCLPGVDPSQPAVGAEVTPQLLNLGGAQRGQGCTAGTPIVAEPLHSLLQPWDPKPAGDLWEGGCEGWLAPMGQGGMLHGLLHWPRVGL